MSNPHIPLDPDPRHVVDEYEARLAHEAELDAAWELGYTTAEGDRRWRVAGLLIAAVSGAILGAAAAIAWGALT